MRKRNYIPPLKAHALCIQLGIELLQKSPTLRKATHISLVDLAEVGKIRRKLLKQILKQ